MTIRALLCDFDGVLRHFDSTAVARAEEAAGFEPGAILRAAFAPERLLPAIRGVVSDAEWRAAIAGDLGGSQEAHAAVAGRDSVSLDDVRAVVHPVLRHRIVTTFSAAAEEPVSSRDLHRASRSQS